MKHSVRLREGLFEINEYEQAFKVSLCKHFEFVFEAGEKIGVQDELLHIHDESKLTRAEFFPYAKHFKGGGDPAAFSVAWLHHIHRNPHHWQHYLFPDGWSMKDSSMEGCAVEMPKKYVLEMVADWMGSSMTYTGAWDMSKWLKGNLGNVHLHSNSCLCLKDVLNKLNYVTTFVPAADHDPCYLMYEGTGVGTNAKK